MRRLYQRIRLALAGALWGLRRGAQIAAWESQGPRQLHVVEILSGIAASSERLAREHYDPIDSTFGERARAARACLALIE